MEREVRTTRTGGTVNEAGRIAATWQKFLSEIKKKKRSGVRVLDFCKRTSPDRCLGLLSLGSTLHQTTASRAPKPDFALFVCPFVHERRDVRTPDDRRVFVADQAPLFVSVISRARRHNQTRVSMPCLHGVEQDPKERNRVSAETQLVGLVAIKHDQVVPLDTSSLVPPDQVRPRRHVHRWTNGSTSVDFFVYVQDVFFAYRDAAGDGQGVRGVSVSESVFNLSFQESRRERWGPESPMRCPPAFVSKRI